MLNNQKTRDMVAQAALVSGVAIALVYCILRIRFAIQAQGMVSGFGFLGRSTGWDISYSVLDYSISDTYARVILIGLLNTIFSGLLSIVGATVIGGLIGLARISPNFLLRTIGATYVNFFRNIPLILQIIFWYQIIGHLPHPRQALQVGGLLFLSNRGLYWPTLDLATWSNWTMLAIGLATIVAIALKRRTLGQANLSRRQALLIGLSAIVVIAFLGAIGQEKPIDIPQLAGLNIRGGAVLQPELCALVFAICLYGGAYIGEVVRSGFMSVRRGQTEAARSLGLKPFHIFSRIQLPLAIRAMLPSLSNQYTLVMKSTTLGIAIGFSEFFFVISTSINQSGQTLELLALLMVGFLAVNLSIGFAMNWLDRRMALKGN
ncbi:ABC transporter permease subunit [Rhizobium calliandrae]|uniref:ABC transporter permease subunit n=2 Tax=Rhizobium TaxID=379 RepID=A0ABT7KND0_9HYPH|nr:MULTISPECIES: ABC transporter permease subunit [Rhizobium]MDL2403746.1 ABC transporter permease subunit [Rhizobium mayense]MDL2409916.1 ABC transporter permease subunit [Rhizobium calliandrae]